MNLTARDRTIGLLRMVGLNKVAARVVYRLEGFKTASGTVLLNAIRQAFEHAKASGVSGDYLEFGVFKGASLLYAQQAADEMKLLGMRFIGFDSFEGLPDEPEQHREIFYKGQYFCGERRVRRWLSQNGADWQRLFLVPGFYDRTLTPEKKQELGLTKCAVAMLDCDIYSSTKLALSWIDDVVGPGSVVILDDWDAYGSGQASWEDGQRRAMKEHSPKSRWVYEELFRYGEGLRGGQAFICIGPRQKGAPVTGGR
jgi:hypothetical protein